MLEKRPIKNVHIYVLKDPETLEVRYVGKTKKPLNKRLTQHLYEKQTVNCDLKPAGIMGLANIHFKPNSGLF